MRLGAPLIQYSNCFDEDPNRSDLSTPAMYVDSMKDYSQRASCPEGMLFIFAALTTATAEILDVHKSNGSTKANVRVSQNVLVRQGEAPCASPVETTVSVFRLAGRGSTRLRVGRMLLGLACSMA